MVTTMDSAIRAKIANTEETLTNGGGAQTAYIPIAPDKVVTVQATLNSSDTMTISVTNQYNADLEDASINWVERYSGSVDQLLFLEAGVTGVKVESTPTNADVDVSVTQVKA